MQVKHPMAGSEGLCRLAWTKNSGISLKMRLVVTCVAIAATAFVVLTAQASAIPWSLLGGASHGEDVASIAENYASSLLSAETPEEIEEILHQILDVVGIGVYDIYGTPIVVGRAVSEDDFFLYDFETRLLAVSFFNGNYLSLEAVVESWQSMGILIVPVGKQTPELVSTLEVDKGLRTLRRQAEEDPACPEGFLVRLLDALGNREDLPFDLLDDDEDDHEPELAGLPVGLRDMVEEQLDLIREEALAEGDQDMLDRLEILNSPAGQRVLIEAMLEGDMLRVMRLLMGEEEVLELAKAAQQAQRDRRLEEEASEPQMQYLGTTGQFFSGFDVDFVQATIDYYRDEVRYYENRRIRQEEEYREELAGRYEMIRSQGGHADDIYRLSLDMAGAIITLDTYKDKQESMSVFVENWADEYEESKEIIEELEETFGMHLGDLGECTGLYFDPIQVLLVHIDMFLEPTDTQRYSQGIMDRLSDNLGSLWDDLVGMVYARSPSPPQWLGALNGVLSTANSVRGTIRDIRNIGRDRSYRGAANAIVRGAVQTAATELHMEVYYCVGPIQELADSYNSIHRRQGEPLREKQIIVRAQISSPFTDALGEVLSSLQPNRHLYGPVLGFFDADPLKLLSDIAAREVSGIAVRFEPDRDFLFEHLHPSEASRWDVMRGITYTKRTNEEGIAEGVFYLREERPDVGGWKAIAPGHIRVQAMVNASAAAMYDPAVWGLAVGEEIMRPVQTYVTVQVGYRIPVERVGTLTLVRAFSEIGSTTIEQGGSTSALTRMENAVLNLNIHRLTMDKEGLMTGEYTASLTGDWREESTSVNSAEGRIVETVTTTSGSFSGLASGTSGGVEFRVDSRANKYLIWPGPILLELLAQMEFSGLCQTVVFTSCSEHGVTTTVHPPDASGSIPLSFQKHLLEPSAVYMTAVDYGRSYDLTGTTSGRRVIPNPDIRRVFGGLPHDFTYITHTFLTWDLKGQTN